MGLKPIKKSGPMKGPRGPNKLRLLAYGPEAHKKVQAHERPKRPKQRPHS